METEAEGELELETSSGVTEKPEDSSEAKGDEVESDNGSDASYKPEEETESEAEDSPDRLSEAARKRKDTFSNRLLGIAESSDGAPKAKKKKISKKLRQQYGQESEYDEQALEKAQKELDSLAEDRVDAEQTDENPSDEQASSDKENKDRSFTLSGNAAVSPIFTKVLKPHQFEGVSFLWNHLTRDQGCILADYMGLGKTLQVICTLHTYLKHKGKKNPVLILAPASVVNNWKQEMLKWFDTKTAQGRKEHQLLNVRVMDSKSAITMTERLEVLQKWGQKGGILVMGYEMFRGLATIPSHFLENSIYTEAQELILSTPSIVVADEGHRLRKAKSQLVKAASQLVTRKRIVLTGYPLQNHLLEYYTMVNFCRPESLGTSAEFNVRFVVPINNGQASDSIESDVVYARQRTYVLNQLLKPIVLRRDSSLLAKELPPKYEWLLRCRQTPIQGQLYRAFVRERIRDAEASNGSANGGIIAAYHHSLSIVNHPDILYNNLQGFEVEKSGKQTFYEFGITLYFQNQRIGLRLLPIDAIKDEMHANVQQLVVVVGVNRGEFQHEHGKLRKFDVVCEVEGVECNSLNQVANLITQVRLSSSVVSLKIRRFHSSTAEYEHIKTFVGIEEAGGENAPASLPTTSSGGAEASSSTNTSTNQDVKKEGDEDDIEILNEFHASKPDGHSLQWAVPVLTEYKAVGDARKSGKMMVLMEILKQARLAEDKVLVFSQSVTTLNLVQSVLIQHNIRVDHARSLELSEGTQAATNKKKAKSWIYLEGAKCNFLRLDGSTPQAHRLQLVDKFNKAPAAEISVFLLSTKAAGEGLNIHSANRVVMFDACWNPCHDHEAMCRAYRFGQRKTTYVYRLVAAGTMERTIYDQQTKKEALIHRVIDAKATKRSVTSKDLRNFFNLKRFNRVQKKTLSKSDLALSSEETEDAELSVEHQNKARERRALSKDKVLLSTLEAPDGYVTEFRLENLLMREDDDEKLQGEDKRLAMELYEKQLKIEEDLIAKGVSPANAASLSVQSVSLGASSSTDYPYSGGSIGASISSSAVATPTLNASSINAVTERYESPRSRPRFSGVSFLVLQRRMQPEEFDFVCGLIERIGGTRQVELGPRTQLLISRWSTDKLEKYVQRIKDGWMKEYNLQQDVKVAVQFRDPDWLYDQAGVPEEKRPKVPATPAPAKTFSAKDPTSAEEQSKEDAVVLNAVDEGEEFLLDVDTSEAGPAEVEFVFRAG